MTVVVDQGHRESTESLRKSLRAAGMDVEQVLTTLGLVTGRLPEDRLPAVRRIEGVSSVETQSRYRLPPPQAPVQ